MLENTKIILASTSPRRKELLAKIGIDYEIITSDIEENTMQVKPDKIVKELSYIKAKDVLEKINKKQENIKEKYILVIGADTVVSKDGIIMGKPKSEADAFQMIKSIQGNTHQVFTGVSILVYNLATKELTKKIFAECTDVTVFKMTDEEIYDYLSQNDYSDKAGAYGIQGAFGLYVEKINGDYDNVVGLPVARLYHELKRAGITPRPHHQDRLF